MLVLLTTVGLGLGKWVHKAGGALMLITFAAVLILPLLNRASGALAEYHPLRTEMPVLSIMSLNLLGKMGFGALGGFEYVANLATQLTELKDFRVTNGSPAPSVVVGDPGPEAEAV